MFYSPSTRGFYSQELHGNNIPADVVAIKQEEHTELLAGQSTGLVITTGTGGFPVLETAPPVTYKQALDTLNITYQVDVAKLNNAFALTLLADGPSESAKMATIRVQYEARKAQHAANIAALKLEYGL